MQIANVFSMRRICHVVCMYVNIFLEQGLSNMIPFLKQNVLHQKKLFKDNIYVIAVKGVCTIVYPITDIFKYL